ncbi:MAG: phosphopentomutase [Eubacteriales bacterium]
MDKRVILIVLDSLGVGALDDAQLYGDLGSNTLQHILDNYPNHAFPNLADLGLFNIDGIKSELKSISPKGSYGRLKEISPGKDTITGHWEIAGLLTMIPFRTFPDGFPKEFISAYEERIGIKTLGNYAASGIDILHQLGPKHNETLSPIVYTSADSVFQIAVNVDLVPLAKLYEYCEIAREMLVGEMQVGRVIARPFIIRNNEYIRTSDRKDYAVSPTGKTMLDNIGESGQIVVGVGKIGDIFNETGITKSIHTISNMDGVDQTLREMKEDFAGLIFTNLVDFDSKYGHRRDPIGYGNAIKDFDDRLPEIIRGLKENDMLILCADHGNDPMHSGWDHTREYVPIIIYGKHFSSNINLGSTHGFSDIGATICEYLRAKKTNIGESFLEKVIR